MDMKAIAKIVAGRTNGAATGAGRVVEVLRTLAWVVGVLTGVVG